MCRQTLYMRVEEAILPTPIPSIVWTVHAVFVLRGIVCKVELHALNFHLFEQWLEKQPQLYIHRALTTYYHIIRILHSEVLCTITMGTLFNLLWMHGSWVSMMLWYPVLHAFIQHLQGLWIILQQRFDTELRCCLRKARENVAEDEHLQLWRWTYLHNGRWTGHET